MVHALGCLRAAILARYDHADLGFARPLLGEIADCLTAQKLLPPGAMPRTAAELVAWLQKKV